MINSEETGKSLKRPPTSGSFPKGKSGNPSGRPSLPDHLKAMKEASLHKVIELIYNTISDDEFIASLKPSERFALIEVVSDRCGLPRVTRDEGNTVDSGIALALVQALDEFRDYQGLNPIAIPKSEQPSEHLS